MAKLQQMLARFGWPSLAKVSRELARDFALPHDAVASVLMEAMTDLRALCQTDEYADARPIIDKAAQRLQALHAASEPDDRHDSLMERYLHELAPKDYQVLRYFKEGKRHAEIAELMKTDVPTVRSSLVRTYSELRIRQSELRLSDG